ncbi:hypothetical protein AB0M43_38160 [Longispora sp. NPDC051575]|uniref:hypothetical protein n=1 Tax=Longispora sp. NPDC051575 TaxID=3154943 RepID=UPI00343A2FED
MMMDIPVEYRELIERHGDGVGVEAARAQFAALVATAEAGEIVLLHRDRWEWAALAPLSEVTEPLAGLPMHAVSAARARLGDLVHAATGWGEAQPQILTRRGRPVAALIAARLLADRPALDDRLDVEELLRAGHQLTATYWPEVIGVMGEYDVVTEPEPAAYVVTVTAHDDPDGRPIAESRAATLAEAMLSLAPWRSSHPDADLFSDRAPF